MSLELFAQKNNLFYRKMGQIIMIIDAKNCLEMWRLKDYFVTAYYCLNLYILRKK